MRAFSVLSLLCGAATVVQGSLYNSIMVPSVIGYNDRVINITATRDPNDPDQSFDVAMIYGFDGSDGKTTPPDSFGISLGELNFLTAVQHDGFLSLTTTYADKTWTKGQFRLVTTGLLRPGEHFGARLWSAEVSYGPTASKTLVPAKVIGQFKYAAN
ncbi:hypothetical protein V8C42DRAFT_327752 [Trichoderma barbatum]